MAIILGGGAVLAATAAVAARRRHRASERAPVETPEPAVDVVPLTPAAESLDDSALCLVWRRTYVLLQHRLPLPSRVRVVQARQQYLDELERRHPRGLVDWLTSGARAAGDPSPYIGADHGPGHEPNRGQGEPPAA